MTTPTTDEDLAEVIGDLVSIETENPPGNEARCTEFIAEWFDERGIETEVIEEPYPDRPQVAARVGEGDPVVVLNGHIDVVLPATARAGHSHRTGPRSRTDTCTAGAAST